LPQTSRKLIFTVSTNPAISGTLPQKEVWQKAPCSLRSDRENTKRTRSSPVQRDETAHPKLDVHSVESFGVCQQQARTALLLKNRCPPSVIQVPALSPFNLTHTPRVKSRPQGTTSKWKRLQRSSLQMPELTGNTQVFLRPWSHGDRKQATNRKAQSTKWKLQESSTEQ
jgi:hypothetical protein